MIKIAVIGGGASGMAAAIAAARAGASVRVFERLGRVGKKLLSTGNGRCNITNENAEQTDESGRLIHYFGTDSDFATPALSAFDHKALLGFFGALGVLFRNEDGKYYPYSETASTVLDVLRAYCARIGVEITENSMVERIDRQNGAFVIDSRRFDRVIVACGGKSSPHCGTDGAGYALLCAFGHRLSKLYPAITQIKTDSVYPRRLKGIKCDAVLTAVKNGKAVRRERGQLLFTDYGLSGPPAFQISSCIDESTQAELDLCPDFSFEFICDNIRTVIGNPYKDGLRAGELLLPMINRRVGQEIIRYCGIPQDASVSSLSERQIKSIAGALKKFRMRLTGVKGFQNAQVTAGGILTCDFDSRTMQSTLCKGLFACGEILDITGDCGGYNLQWAFSSGFAAGKAAAEC